ncbi:MAG: hypothetical protein Q8M35_11705, partial [Pseudohongiella sp.]|nr:hypothetical protein [Pseudohongiella sp.]
MRKSTLAQLILATALASLGACSEPAVNSAAVDAPAAGSAVAALDVSQSIADPALAAQALLEAEIALGSAVKRMCSSVLVSGRTQAQVMSAELAGATFANMSFEFNDDIVSVSANGLTAQALFRPHLGCTLLKETSPEILRAQFNPALYPQKPDVAAAPWPL